MRVISYPERCAASGNCARIAPAVFGQSDDDGTVVVLDATPPDALHDTILDAVDTCPTGAIDTAPD
jgi:ferredoxin